MAFIIWKNFYEYAGIIPLANNGEDIVTLKMQLKRLGFPIEEMDASYDMPTRQAVEALQARHGLDVDGMVGPLTKIAIYNEDRSLDLPRLAEISETTAGIQ